VDSPGPWVETGFCAVFAGLLCAYAIGDGDSWKAVALALLSVGGVFYAVRTYRRSRREDQASGHSTGPES
jgi:cbb3-type cytochrome oxidase subunit 3